MCSKTAVSQAHPCFTGHITLWRSPFVNFCFRCVSERKWWRLRFFSGMLRRAYTIVRFLEACDTWRGASEKPRLQFFKKLNEQNFHVENLSKNGSFEVIVLFQTLITLFYNSNLATRNLILSFLSSLPYYFFDRCRSLHRYDDKGRLSNTFQNQLNRIDFSRTETVCTELRL